LPRFFFALLEEVCEVLALFADGFFAGFGLLLVFEELVVGFPGLFGV